MHLQFAEGIRLHFDDIRFRCTLSRATGSITAADGGNARSLILPPSAFVQMSQQSMDYNDDTSCTDTRRYSGSSSQLPSPNPSLRSPNVSYFIPPSPGAGMTMSPLQYYQQLQTPAQQLYHQPVYASQHMLPILPVSSFHSPHHGSLAPQHQQVPAPIPIMMQQQYHHQPPQQAVQADTHFLRQQQQQQQHQQHQSPRQDSNLQDGQRRHRK